MDKKLISIFKKCIIFLRYFFGTNVAIFLIASIFNIEDHSGLIFTIILLIITLYLFPITHKYIKKYKLKFYLIPLIIIFIGSIDLEWNFLEAIVYNFIFLIGTFFIIKFIEIKKIRKEKEEKQLSERKKVIYPLVEQFNRRYFTIEQKFENLQNLTDLVNHKLGTKYTIESIKHFLIMYEKEQNISLFNKEISKLKNKSSKNIAKLLITLEPEKDFTNKMDYEGIFEELTNFLSSKNIFHNPVEIHQELNEQYKLKKVIEFEERLKRNHDTKLSVEEIEHLNGFEFEELIGDLFKKAGYKVNVTKKSGDQGADLVVEKEGFSTAIQTKKHTGNVGNKAVQEVVASMKFYDCDEGMVITTANFTKSAYELASRNKIKLVDKKGLNKLFDDIL